MPRLHHFTQTPSHKTYHTFALGTVTQTLGGVSNIAHIISDPQKNSGQCFEGGKWKKILTTGEDGCPREKKVQTEQFIGVRPFRSKCGSIQSKNGLSDRNLFSALVALTCDFCIAPIVPKSQLAPCSLFTHLCFTPSTKHFRPSSAIQSLASYGRR
jgi:hypothetical protein